MVSLLRRIRKRCHGLFKNQIYFECLEGLAKTIPSNLISSAKRGIGVRMKGVITMMEQAVEVKIGSKLSVKDLTTTGMMIAIILLMSFTPLGYLRTAGLEVSLITIPVAIGAMIIGPKAGLLLGTVFGLTSFYQCFGMSPFGAALLGINPF